MQITKKQWLIVGVGLLIAVLVAGGFWYDRAEAPVREQSIPESSPTAFTTTPVATPPEPSIPKSVTTSRMAPHPLSLANGDTIISWDFQGAYTDKPELVAKAQDEINRLSSLLAMATSSTMILSVGIANQYELLGKGKEQYDYLGRAIRAAATNGLPWHNLGVLMERFGAYQTARIAYEKATVLQPQFSFYHFAYLEFLTARMRDNTAAIEKAFAMAEENLGKIPYLLELRIAWEKS